MANSKKIEVKVLKEFYDKKKKVKRAIGEQFEVTVKRLDEIQKFETENKIKLVEVIKNDLADDSKKAGDNNENNN